MDKAEQAAQIHYQYYPESDKASYIDGYRRAEADLELTWQDIQRIVQISYDLDPIHNDEHRLAEFNTEEAFYKEVLKRFEEGKQ